MSKHQIMNDKLTICINELGAELSSIWENKTQIEYLWKGDPTYWRGQSPILFPIVGKLKNNTYTYQDQSYTMSQHGFAREMEFKLLIKKENEIWFELESTAETEKIYPFRFHLEVGYCLKGSKITVQWKLWNKDNKTMYFSIGAHPAFLCPINQEGNQTDYSIRFDTQNPIHYQKINGEGLLVKKPFHEQAILATTDYLLPITNDLFKEGAFIIENNQCHKVSLVNADKKTYVSVSFDAALFGLWSPINNAPFICIEPWYGRCDSSDFCGSLEEREWGNQLNAGMQFIASYTIEIA